MRFRNDKLLIAMNITSILLLVILLVVASVIKEKDHQIKNLQDEMLMLKEENLDITNYNQELVDQIEAMRGSEENK